MTSKEFFDEYAKNMRKLFDVGLGADVDCKFCPLYLLCRTDAKCGSEENCEEFLHRVLEEAN